MSLKDKGPKWAKKRWDAISIIYRRGKIIQCPIVLAANNLNSPACLSCLNGDGSGTGAPARGSAQRDHDGGLFRVSSCSITAAGDSCEKRKVSRSSLLLVSALL